MLVNLRPLSEKEIKAKLKNFPGWQYAKNKIAKTFEFVSFSDGLKLVNKLAPFCNKIDHHPDICIYYKKINFALTRYSIGGKVTNRDFKVASKIEELFRQYQESLKKKDSRRSPK